MLGYHTGDTSCLSWQDQTIPRGYGAQGSTASCWQTRKMPNLSPVIHSSMGKDMEAKPRSPLHGTSPPVRPQVIGEPQNTGLRKQSTNLLRSMTMNRETHFHNFQLTRPIFIFLQIIPREWGKAASLPAGRRLSWNALHPFLTEIVCST